MPRRFAILLAFAVVAACCSAALAADSALSAKSAASAAPAKPSEPSRSHFENDPPHALGEKIIEKPADGTVIEKFLVHSAAMNRNVHVVVVLPPAYAAEPAKRFPVLYTLHGSDATYEVFSKMPPLRAALKQKPMLVVGFDGDKLGWYIDSTVRRDSQFETFFFKELIPYIEKNYRASTEAKARGVTGFSMGGYGAFHYMVVHPEMFASASSLSGIFHVIMATDLLGDPVKNQEAYARLDVKQGLEAALAKGVKLPPLLLTCGTEDGLIRESRDMRRWLTEKKIPFEYVEKSGGHAWPFWRDSSADIIDFHWRSFQGNYQPMEHPASVSATTAASAVSASSALHPQPSPGQVQENFGGIQRRMEKTEVTPEGCTIEKFSIMSPSASREIHTLVLLPPEYKDHPEKRYPVLYALPGAWGQREDLGNMATLRQALKDKPMIVASFEPALVSFYADFDALQKVDNRGGPLQKCLDTTFFFDELIPCVDQNYRVNPKQRMLTGMSMGSYGAYHYMTTKFDLFVSVSTICNCFPHYPGKNDIWTPIKERVTKGLKLPKLYMRVGFDDYLLVSSREMHKFLQELGIPHDYLETPGGHSYAYFETKTPGMMYFHWQSIHPELPPPPVEPATSATSANQPASATPSLKKGP